MKTITYTLLYEILNFLPISSASAPSVEGKFAGLRKLIPSTGHTAEYEYSLKSFLS